MAQFISGQVEQPAGEKFKHFLRSLTSKRAIGLLSLLFIFLALPMTVYISLQKQQYRQHAAYNQQQCFSFPPENAGVANTMKQNFIIQKSQLLLPNVTNELYRQTRTKNGGIKLEAINQDAIFKLLSARKQFLIDTMRNNPSKAIDNILSDKDNVPFLSFTNCTEQKTTLEGTLEIFHADDFKNKREKTFYYLRTNNKDKIQLHFTKEINTPLISSMHVRITGYKLDHDMLVDTTIPPMVKKNFEIISSSAKNSSFNLFKTTVYADIPDSMGEQKTVVLLVNFQNTPQPTRTKADIQDVFFNQTNNFYKEVSYGKTYITGAIFPPVASTNWYTLSIDQTCDSNAILNASIKAADTDVDFTQYTRLVLLVPTKASIGGGEGCLWGGLGSVGKYPLSTADGIVKMSVSWDNANADMGVMGHEFGHNLGLMHANFINCGSTVLTNNYAKDCTHVEYGDYYDIMGALHGRFNAPHTDYLGWFANANIQTVTASGNYTIEPLESITSGLKAIKLQRDSEGINDFLSVEYRQPIGIDQSINGHNTNVFNGVLLHINNFASYILDTSPPGDEYSDIALGVGNTFIDPATGAKVTLKNIDSAKATVSVKMGKTDTIPPTVIVTSPIENTSVSGTVTISANADDASGIQKVEFYVKNNLRDDLIGTVTQAPYSISWDTTHAANGYNYIYAIAYDKSGEAWNISGNIGYSDPVGVTVSNIDTIPPMLSIISPHNGDTLKNPVTITINATDNIGVSYVECWKDDDLYAFYYSTNAPYTCTTSDDNFTSGTHTIYAKAYDYVGNITTSNSISVTVLSTISWKTSTVSFEANKFMIITADKTFYANASDITLRSDSDKILEVTWHENGVEMRFNLYFDILGTSWKVTEIRTYNGNDPGDWLYYPVSISSELGKPYATDFLLVNSNSGIGMGSIYIENLKLNAFLDLITPTPTVSSSPSPTATPSPTPTDIPLNVKIKKYIMVPPSPTPR